MPAIMPQCPFGKAQAKSPKSHRKRTFSMMQFGCLLNGQGDGAWYFHNKSATQKALPEKPQRPAASAISCLTHS
jgi:hypothetical protein